MRREGEDDVPLHLTLLQTSYHRYFQMISMKKGEEMKHPGGLCRDTIQTESSSFSSQVISRAGQEINGFDVASLETPFVLKA